MAETSTITILSTPSNPIEPIFVEGGWNNSYTLSSSKSSYCSMKYVGDLYVNTVLTTRIKNSPNLTNGKCVITPWRILEDFVSSDRYVGLTPSLFQNCTNSKVQYQLIFGEEYDGTVGCTGSSFDIVFGASASRYAFNGTLQYGETWNYTEWYVTKDAEAKFLTNAPREQDININESSFLYYISDFVTAPSGLTSSSQTLRVTVTGTGGTSSTYYVHNLSATIPYDILAIGVGPVDLNRYVTLGLVRTSDYTLISEDIISCGTARYTVGISTPVRYATELFTFNVNCDCERFTPYRFVWRNRRGGFDTYTFRLRDKKVVNIQKKGYQKFLNSLQANDKWTYNFGDRGKEEYWSSAFEEVNVFSTYLTEFEGRWLEEIYTSVEVYLLTFEDGAYKYNPIVITSNSVEIRDKKGYSNRLLSHNITFIYSYNKIINT